MATFTIETPDRELIVEIDDESVRPLIGRLEIASPALAEKFEEAMFVPLQALVLDEREVELFSDAAKTVSNSLVEDPALEQLTQL